MRQPWASGPIIGVGKVIKPVSARIGPSLIDVIPGRAEAARGLRQRPQPALDDFLGFDNLDAPLPPDLCSLFGCCPAPITLRFVPDGVFPATRPDQAGLAQALYFVGDFAVFRVEVIADSPQAQAGGPVAKAFVPRRRSGNSFGCLGHLMSFCWGLCVLGPPAGPLGFNNLPGLF